MRQTWRWFGPQDPISVDGMLQAGVEGVVSALHHIPNGVVWSGQEIAQRRNEIAHKQDGSPSGLAWEVVESLPVSEQIKKQQGDWRAHIAAYQDSLRNIAAAGIEVVCYNFMPVLDWTRTELAYRVPTGGTCMRFDYVDFAAFDLHILERRGAASGYDRETLAAAEARYREFDEGACQELTKAITCGLPGAADTLTLNDVRRHLAEYDNIDADQLRANLVAFLEQVAPLAQEMGLRLCCHPDDPPFPLLGLPRILSTLTDYQAVTTAVDLPSNGVTFCAGSLGARPDNLLPSMMETLGDRVHFIHLRNVRRETKNIAGSFYEADHLEGDTDMVALIAAVHAEEARRRQAGRQDTQIPMRPDHGQDILDDIGRDGQPGYPVIGRLKALAELRGIMTALTHPKYGTQT